ncbi:MAG TPA: DUF3310 domain-containing protein [Paludibacteraceae bacterium]|nr:DUF3310 domain-containing protein [Paludibacteraceae bacterium]
MDDKEYRRRFPKADTSKYPVASELDFQFYDPNRCYQCSSILFRQPDGINMADNKDNDPVNHPAHYTAYKGLEIIDLTEQMNFNRGNAVKYITRAGLKDKAHELEDLEKAIWYTQREIQRIKKEAGL